MSGPSPRGFLLSAAFHAVVIGFAILFYIASQHVRETPRVLELVAGEGADYMATEAPASAAEPVTLNVFAPPPEPVRAQPAPVPPKVEPPVAPNWAQQIKNTVQRANTTAKKEVAKQKAAEQKRLEEERRLEERRIAETKRLEEKKRADQEKQKTMTKEEFDRLNKSKTAPPKKTAPVKVARIDAERLAKEVLAGTAKTKAGASGNALTAAEAGEVERYIALLLRRLKEELDQTPGVEDGLRAEAEFHILGDGRLVRGQIVRSSGDESFDRAVLRAISAVRMPARPKGLNEVQKVPFSTHARN